MAQPTQSTPTVNANISGTRHQVNLRDYLNARVAPFLKKAITESLDASPEFPLQWLGENLINQSILFEGNPDSTNIKERFLYNFDAPPVPPAPTTLEDDAVAVQDVPPDAPDQSLNQIPQENGIPVSDETLDQGTEMAGRTNGEAQSTPNHQHDEPRDTDMAGTS